MSPRATLEAYDAVIGVTQNTKRPVRRTRYVVRCDCGWTVSGCDYIDARRFWRDHKSKCPA